MRRRTTKPLLAGVLALAGVSCAGAASADTGPRSGAEVYEQTVAQRDQAKGLSWVNGPKVGYGREPSRWFFRALYLDDQKGHAGIQLYVADVPDGESWAFYEHAGDPAGNPLELIRIDRDTQLRSGEVVCIEQLAVNLTEEYLLEHGDGFAVRIWGNGGERTLEIPGYYVGAFLFRLREFSSDGELSSRPMEGE